MEGVVWPVANELDVYLRPTAGFSSETLAYNAAQDVNPVGKAAFIYQVGDFDPYGMEAWQAAQDRLGELAQVPVHFERVAATEADLAQFIDLSHEVKPPKNNHKSTVTRIHKHTDVYGSPVLEVDAIPTPVLRDRLRSTIMRHITQEHIDAVTAAQENDRAMLAQLAEQLS
jgi:hypothetical protein